MLWRMGVELQANSRLGVDYQLEELTSRVRRRVPRPRRLQQQRHGRAPARTPTAWSRPSTSSASSSSPATSTSATRSPSSAAASPPWTPAAPASARARPRSPASTAARARRCRRTSPRSTRPRRRASSSSCSAPRCASSPTRTTRSTGIEMQRMELGEPDASGRRRPVPVEGSEFVIECDQVIAAIGQFPKLDGTSEEQGVKRTKWRTIAGERLDLPDGGPARVRRRRRRARRADRHPGRRPGQEGRLEHGRLPARRGHGRRGAVARRAQGDAVLQRAQRTRRRRPAPRAHGRGPAGVHRHDHRRHAPQPAGRDAQAGARRPQDELPADRARLRRGRGRPRRRAVPAVLLPGQRQVRPAALRHRVRGVQEPLPRRRRPRLPGRLPPRLHHARAQPLHQLRPLRARLPHGGRVELLRQHGPRLRHHRQHRRQPAAAARRLRELRQVRRDVPHGLHRDQPAHPRQLRPRREPLHLLRRVRRGLPLRRARADRLLRARRLQPHGDGARVALRARVAPGRDAARDRQRPRARTPSTPSAAGAGSGSPSRTIPSRSDDPEEQA